MKKLLSITLLMSICWCVAAGQTKEFMNLYGEAGKEVSRSNSGITTMQLSGKMLQEIAPGNTDGRYNVVNRIENIRQVKFAPQSDKSLYVKFLQMAADSCSGYEQMSYVNEDGQSVRVYKAPYGKLKGEYLVLISNNDASLVCDIVGNVGMKDIMEMIYGK